MKRKTYVAASDYGKRNSELDKQVMQFGNHAVTLYRRPDARRSSWYFRIHIKQERRHYRKSLNTNDLNQAKFAAQDEVVNILAKVRSGQRVLDLSLGDLKRQFELHMDRLVEQGGKSKETRKNHRYRIKLGIDFLNTKYPKGLEAKLSQIDGTVFRDYLIWRLTDNKAKGRTLRRDVVRDELLVIRKMFKFARDNKLCSEKTVPSWQFDVEPNGPQRRRIDGNQFNDFARTTIAWVKEAANTSSYYHRYMVLHLLALVSVTGMRSGEAFGLKNEDIELKGENEAVIKVSGTTSKRRRNRVITANTGTFRRWLDKRIHKEPDDYCFSPANSGKISARDVFYHQYRSLRESLKRINLEWIDLYHCRHMFITNLIYAGQHLGQIAKVAGTSQGEIESTYDHVLTQVVSREFNQTQVLHRPDGSVKIIKRKPEDLELEEILRSWDEASE
jgi:integrase